MSAGVFSLLQPLLVLHHSGVLQVLRFEQCVGVASASFLKQTVFSHDDDGVCFVVLLFSSGCPASVGGAGGVWRACVGDVGGGGGLVGGLGCLALPRVGGGGLVVCLGWMVLYWVIRGLGGGLAGFVVGTPGVAANHHPRGPVGRVVVVVVMVLAHLFTRVLLLYPNYKVVGRCAGWSWGLRR